jgi:hypothetical protein
LLIFFPSLSRSLSLSLALILPLFLLALHAYGLLKFLKKKDTKKRHGKTTQQKKDFATLLLSNVGHRQGLVHYMPFL